MGRISAESRQEGTCHKGTFSLFEHEVATIPERGQVFKKSKYKEYSTQRNIFNLRINEDDLDAFPANVQHWSLHWE